MLLPLLSILTTALAAGVGVHTALVSRVHQFLPPELQTEELIPFLVAGAFFPDAFYTCGAPDTSEAAHWPPFIGAAVEHYHHNYRQDTPRGLQFKAFVYGAFTHQIADSSWHSIRLHEGLLKMLAHMEFDDVERAHQFLDTAGDFFLLNRIGAMEYFHTQWQLPELRVLRDVFAQLGITTREFELKYCTMRGESALRAETTFAKTAAPMNAQISPLLEDVLDSYYIGGLREIEQSVARCMPHLTSWFDNGVPSDPWSLCGAIIPGEEAPELIEEDRAINISKEGTIISPYTPLSNFGHAIATGNFLQEPSLAISSQFEEGQGSVYILPLSEFTHTASISTLSLHPHAKPFQAPPRFGTAMMTYTLFHESFLFISEPGTSSIYVYSGNRRVLTIKDHKSSSSYGAYGRKQQGINMMARDIDGDGFPELFISAPFSDVDDRAQGGEVIILSGEKLATLLLLGQEFIVDVDELVEHRLRTPKEYELKDGYEQFGSVVTVDDSMIFVTSPGHGVVFCFDYGYDLKQATMKQQNDGVIVMRRHSAETGMFGQKWMTTGSYNGQRYLIVSAHMENQANVAATGAVYVYTVEEHGVKFLKKLILSAGTGSVLAKFGTRGVVYDDVLYVSAPGYFGSGAVFKVPLSEIFADVTQRESITVNKVFMEGSGPGYTGFGESLEAYNRYLIIGEPNFGYGEMFDDTKKMTGRVGIYKV